MSAETIEFQPWPKIARLNRDITITEKIDGTNAAIVIDQSVEHGWVVGAQSRSRIITPANDNHGFARWVEENRLELIALLGPGRHFGEWWGQGIQRKYGLDHKRFSLFNTHRHAGISGVGGQLGVVPVLYEGPFSIPAINDALDTLHCAGSVAAPCFDKPEGVVIFHHHANTMFKITLENDDVPKGAVA